VREQWQFNPRLSVNLIPSWDGTGSTILTYLTEMAGLARMSNKTNKGLAQLAPWKWEGKARSWWIVLPPVDEAYITRDWHTLLWAIRAKFLDATWI
jgi:hypothetical protein